MHKARIGKARHEHLPSCRFVSCMLDQRRIQSGRRCMLDGFTMTNLTEAAKQTIATSHKLVEDAKNLREENKKLIKEAQNVRIKIGQSFSQRSD
jgi:hypothetical protein